VKHKTVKVSRGTVEVDEALAPLIPLLWAAGIQTCQCCQEWRPGEAAIDFPDLAAAMEFLNVVGREYSVEVEAWDEGEEGRPNFVCNLLVFFPVKDVPRLIRRFEIALAPSEI
jgi:hypothetical protein